MKNLHVFQRLEDQDTLLISDFLIDIFFKIYDIVSSVCGNWRKQNLEG